jgi:hypothetical protein
MYLRIMGLKSFKEILLLRQKYMKGTKLSKEEKKYVLNVLNDEIEEYMKQKRYEFAQQSENVVKENILAQVRMVQEKNAKATRKGV